MTFYNNVQDAKSVKSTNELECSRAELLKQAVAQFDVMLYCLLLLII